MHSSFNKKYQYTSGQGVPDILKVAKWNSKSPLRSFITVQVTPSIHHSYFLQSSRLQVITCFKRNTIVHTVPCIRNLRNRIYRFPKDIIHTGRMDCMRRWRIQGTGTVDSHLLFTVCNTSTPSLCTVPKRGGGDG